MKRALGIHGLINGLKNGQLMAILVSSLPPTIDQRLRAVLRVMHCLVFAIAL